MKDELEWEAFVFEQMAIQQNKMRVLDAQFPFKTQLSEHNWSNSISWLITTFGSPGTLWDYVKSDIWFANEQDMMMYILKFTK